MQPLIPFDSLPEQEQLEVLRYIEATNSEDIEQAIRVLRSHNMKAQDALRSNYQDERSSSSFYTVEQEQELTDYASFLRAEAVKRVTCGHCLRQCGKKIKAALKWLIPSFIKRLVRKNTFESTYRSYSQVKLFEGTLEDAFLKAQSQQKCVCILVSRSFSKKMGQLLHNQETSSILNSRFICLGTSVVTEQVSPYLEDITQPCLIVAYRALLGKPVVLGKFSTSSVNKELLTKTVEEYRVQRRHQKNIIIRYNNKFMAYYDDQFQEEIPEDQEFYESQIFRQQQAREYEEASNIRLKQKMEEEAQKKRVQEMLHQRSIRKTSISSEPDHDKIVSLQFRCPNGNKLRRKFGLDQPVENIYVWVQTNQEIEFQQQPIRNFDLLKGYPPQSIAGLKSKTIEEAFEDKYELITIKES